MSNARGINTRGTKTAFVERAPAGMSAAEVVAAAKREGIILSPHTVHTVRSRMRTEGKAGKAPRADDDRVAELRRLVLQVGYDRAAEVLAIIADELDSLGLGGRHGKK